MTAKSDQTTAGGWNSGRKRSGSAFLLCVGWLVLAAMPVWPVTLGDLRSDAKLSPQRFASYFSEFRYQFFEEVQLPEIFLSSETGDCDDYATLAASILRERGFRPHLVAVRMPGLVHVVCYIEEIKGYLDYNNRIYFKRTVSCEEGLRSIAKKVAKSFDANWTSASEFSFSDGLKHMVSTIAKTQSPGGSIAYVGARPPGVGERFQPLPVE